MCLNGFLPAVSYAAAQIEYLYIGDDVITVEMGVTDCPEEWLEDDSTENGSSSNGSTEVKLANDNFSTPMLINREQLDNGIYIDSYLVTETFNLYGFPENVTLRGALDIEKDVTLHVFEFNNTNSEHHYIDVRADIRTIDIFFPNDKFLIGNSSGHGAYDRIDNFGREAFQNESYAFVFHYCDYFPGTSEVEVFVEYYVTVYSSTSDYKFELGNNTFTVKHNGVSVENGNTLNSSDTAIQSYLQQIYNSTNNIESLQQQGNQLQQEAIDKIENQYSVSEEEDFGVEDIVDQVNQKAGVLSFGTDTLVNFLDLFDAANATNTKLTFPGFSMKIQGVDYQVWPDYHYDLSELENQFGALIEVVRWSCVMVVWLAVLNYLVKAYDTIFGR